MSRLLEWIVLLYLCKNFTSWHRWILEWGLRWPGVWNLVVQALTDSNRPRMVDDRKPIWLVKYGVRQLAATQETNGVGGCPSRGDCGPRWQGLMCTQRQAIRWAKFRHPGRGQHWGHLPAAGTGHRSMGRAGVQNVKVTKKEEGTERDVAASR